MSQVASITNSYINISADGTDASNIASTIDLSALTTFTESGGPIGISRRRTAATCWPRFSTAPRPSG